jgi:hypothetical protein
LATKLKKRKEEKMRLKSGEVVVDRFKSHNHLSGKLASLLPEALARIESNGRDFLVEEVDFGRPIGETICVPTGPGDEIVYAKRPKRWGLSRFVLNRQPEPCSSLVVILKKAEDIDGYILISAFIGHRPEPEPWDVRNFSQQPNPAEAERRSREFWASHALVWGCEEVINNTITAECPW